MLYWLPDLGLKINLARHVLGIATSHWPDKALADAGAGCAETTTFECCWGLGLHRTTWKAGMSPTVEV